MEDTDDDRQASEGGRRAYRALFISDIHLGTHASQAEAFLDFLSVHDAAVIYLVGDIIDFWRVKRGPIWPQSHNDVLQKLLRKVRKGARIIFIPGNHDEALRAYCGSNFGGIEIHRDIVHVAADGRRFLIMHGDEFDVVVRYAKWLAFLGDRSYEFALWCNYPINWCRRWFGFGYWSLSAYLKLRVKSAVNFIGEFENAIAQEARRRDADGVICGHIHHAADRMIDGVRYINCGDWVESCTAITEDHDGQLRLIRWPNAPVVRPRRQPASLPAPAPILVSSTDLAVPSAHRPGQRPVPLPSRNSIVNGRLSAKSMPRRNTENERLGRGGEFNQALKRRDDRSGRRGKPAALRRRVAGAAVRAGISNLVYPQIWEDPAVDLEALALNETSRIIPSPRAAAMG